MTSDQTPLRVCYFGTYRAEYSRNQIMIEGLRRAGVEVIECHATLWHGIEDRVQTASGGWLRPAFWRRVLQTYGQLLKRYRQVGTYDILIVGYPGQYDVFLAHLLARLRRRPLVWDVLNSMYLITMERGIADRHPTTAKIIRFLEKLACRQADVMILDCQAFVDWFSETHGAARERFRLVPIGADDTVFRLAMETTSTLTCSAQGAKDFKVLYYGSYIPNHGVPVIIEAARRLKAHPEIRFELVGSGPERKRAQSLAQGLPNVTFTDWLEKPELAARIAECDVCLGTFGATQQALVTNNNKIYEGFAIKKPVISGASPAMPEALKHSEHLYLCERGNPQALAEAIQTLRNDPVLCKRLGEKGYRIFHEQFDVAHIGEVFAARLRELVSR